MTVPVLPPAPVVRAALAPAVVYLAVRGVGTAVLVLLAGANGGRLGDRLDAWDGHWFLGIAQGWYGDVPLGLVDASGARTAATPLAFFPGYPALVAIVRFVTGVPLLVAAVVVTVGAGVLAAYAVARIGRAVPGGSPRAGLVLVALFASAPMAVVLSMAYSEALFCACAAWALVFLLERRWSAAGMCCLAAGLVRPTAWALLIVAVAAAAVALYRREDDARPWATIALAPVGLLGYLAWVGLHTGSPTGWFTLQATGWGSRVDGGQATLRWAGSVLASGPSIFEVGTILALAGAGVLLLVGLRDAAAAALPWTLYCYGALVVAMDVGSAGVMASKARLLLPAFTLLIPVAIALARLAERHRVAAVGLVAGVVLASAWFGGYAVAIWPAAI
ncbi:integral membrane protein [Pseudonocardia sp. N23]|nr:integral membrane protein [Pseudonocardia sp. N23]